MLLGLEEFKGLWQPYATIDADFRGTGIGSFDGSAPRDRVRREMIAGINRMAEALRRSGDVAEAQKQQQGAEGTADELLKALDKGTKDRTTRLHSALLVAILPPIVLLGLGLTITWVAMGFRSADRAK